MSSVHQVKQSYWFSPHLPHVESRSTWNSSHAYKMHSHSQLSLGAIITGNTLCHYRGETHLLQVLIDADEPHSCNPLPGQARSYHMLYIDIPWCLSLLELGSTDPVFSLRCTAIRLHDSQLFNDYDVD